MEKGDRMQLGRNGWRGEMEGEEEEGRVNDWMVRVYHPIIQNTHLSLRSCKSRERIYCFFMISRAIGDPAKITPSVECSRPLAANLNQGVERLPPGSR